MGGGGFWVVGAGVSCGVVAGSNLWVPLDRDYDDEVEYLSPGPDSA